VSDRDERCFAETEIVEFFSTFSRRRRKRSAFVFRARVGRLLSAREIRHDQRRDSNAIRESAWEFERQSRAPPAFALPRPSFRKLCAFSKARFSGEPPSIEVSVDFSEAEGPNDVTDSSDVSVSSTRVRRERHTPVARRSRRDAHDDDRRYLPASRAVAGNASEARLTARDRA
jgi:hypothetical protein